MRLCKLHKIVQEMPVGKNLAFPAKSLCCRPSSDLLRHGPSRSEPAVLDAPPWRLLLLQNFYRPARSFDGGFGLLADRVDLKGQFGLQLAIAKDLDTVGLAN